MTYEEIRAKIRTLEDKNRDIRNELYNLYNEEYELISERLKPLIGMCFKNRHFYVYYKIIGVPEKKFDIQGHNITNYNQIPCIIVEPQTNDKFPYVGTILTKCYNKTNPILVIKTEYEEISNDEFDNIATKCFEYELNTKK